MGKNDRNDYLRVFLFWTATMLFAISNWTDIVAQKPFHQSTEIEKLRRLGAKQIDSSGTEFEIDGVRLSLSYSMTRLAVVQVEINETGSKLKYDKLIDLIEQVKPLGAFQSDRPIGVIKPTGWLSRTTEFSNAYIVRMEQNCSSVNMESSCGIKKFTVFYWLPLLGKVENKRTEDVDIGVFIRSVRYYVTVNGFEVEVSALDYQRLYKDQFISLERTLGNDLARVVESSAATLK